ncbi:hypothetical protein Tco_0414835 [Tanacetum coccineum]
MTPRPRTLAQRRLEDMQFEEKTNTSCLVNKQVHHGANVGAVIMKTGVPGQEGAEGNTAERYRGDNNMAALRVAAVIEEYAHESLTFRDAVAYEVEIWVTKGLLDEAKEIILCMEIFRTQSGKTLRVSRFRFTNGMSVQILLGGHSTLSLEGSLSGNHDKEKKSGPQSEVPTLLVEAAAYQRRLTIIIQMISQLELISSYLISPSPFLTPIPLPPPSPSGNRITSPSLSVMRIEVPHGDSGFSALVSRA